MIEDPNNRREGRGRSEQKRAARVVEALAARIVELSAAVTKNLPLPDDVREDLHRARSIKAPSARKRQIKHLAGLLRRDEDTVAAVQAALDAFGRTNRAEQDAFQRIERMRDAFCDPDRLAQAIERAADEFPNFDRQVFVRLAAKVHRTGDKRASREIFRRLRALMEVSHED